MCVLNRAYITPTIPKLEILLKRRLLRIVPVVLAKNIVVLEIIVIINKVMSN